MATRPLIKESLILLNAVGVDPYKRNGLSNLRLALTIFLVVLTCLNILMDLMFKWKGLKSAEGIVVIAAMFQVLTKLFVLIIERENLAEMINKMNQFWTVNKYGEELQTEIQNTYMFVKKFMNLFVGFVIIALPIFFIIAMATRTLPYQTYYPKDLNRSPDFEIVFCLDLIEGLNVALFLLAFDFLFVSLLINIICELKIIKMAVRKLPINLNIGDDTEASLEELYKIVDHHNLVLGCIKSVRGIYSILFLIIYFYDIVVLSTGMLSMIASGFPPNMANFSRFGMATVFYISQLFLYCAIGQYLITESESVSATVYEIDWWIKTQPKLRRALVMVIQRANKSENLTAGGMFVLNLESFRKATSSAMSFYTLVNAVYNDN